MLKSLFLEFNLLLPRKFLIDSLKETIFPYVDEELKGLTQTIKTSEGLILIHQLPRLVRLKSFRKWSQTQTLNEVSVYSTRTSDLHQKVYLNLLKDLQSINQGDNLNEYQTKLSSLNQIELKSFFELESLIIDVHPFFYDEPDSIDGVLISDFRSLMFSLSTIDELKQLGKYYQVAIPAYVPKQKVIERVLEELNDKGVLTNGLQDKVQHSSLSELRELGEEFGVNAKTYFLKNEIIEYILENAVQTNYQYLKPVEKNVYYLDEIKAFEDYFKPLLDENSLTKDERAKLILQAKELFVKLHPNVQAALSHFKPIFESNSVITENVNIDQSQHETIINQTVVQQPATVHPPLPEPPQATNQQDLSLSLRLLEDSLRQQIQSLSQRVEQVQTQLSQPANPSSEPQLTSGIEVIQQQLLVQSEAIRSACECRSTKRQGMGFFPAFLLLLNTILIGSLLYFLFFGNGLQTGYLYIGTNRQLLVNEAVNPTKALVPKGVTPNDQQIDEFTYVFRPIFSAPMMLEVQVMDGSRQIGDINNSFNDLLIIQLYDETVPLDFTEIESLETPLLFNPELELYTTNIYVRVFLDEPEPEDYEEAYNAISGQIIRFSLLFEVYEII